MTDDAPPPTDVSRVFELEPHGPDVWVGESPLYPWGRIYGGLVVAQALWAATQTVVPEHSVHSLHGYFILAGNPREPVRYEVERLRNGRSFTTRQVVARQSGGAIFNLACSFQRHEDGIETQTAEFPADAPPPGSFAPHVEGSGLVNFEVPLPAGTPRSLVWSRFPEPLPDDPRVHTCALAYITDTNAMRAAASSHPALAADADEHETLMMASLDHAVWFHRPTRADDWVLLDLDGHGIIRTRGLSTGEVFSADGQHIATIAQEGLIRERIIAVPAG